MISPKPGLLLLVMLPMLGASCHTVRPEGTTRDILTGDVFAGSKLHDPGPVDYTEVEKKEIKPPVRWKVEF